MESGDGDDPGTMPLCLSGFSGALDWRPTVFLEPVVAQSACALCGLVSQVSFRLSCAHILCAECHDVCTEQGSTCPIDSEAFCEDDFIPIHISYDYIIKRKVACWNVSGGCDFMGPLSTLFEHHKECVYQEVPCPRCRTSLLKTDIVDHNAEGWCIPTPGNTPARNIVTRGHNRIENVCNELEEAVRKLSEDLSSVHASVNQCSEDIKAVDQRAKDQLEAQSSKLLEEFTNLRGICAAGFAEDQRVQRKVALDIGNTVKSHTTKELRAHTEKLVTSTAGVTQSLLASYEPKELHWYFEGWPDFKKRASEGRVEKARSPAEYLCGYKVVHVIKLEKKDEKLCFSSCLEIYRGENDAKLEWPFNKTYTMAVVHPRSSTKTISHTTASQSSSFFERPKDYCCVNYPVSVQCTADELESGEFLRAGTLHLSLQIEP